MLAKRGYAVTVNDLSTPERTLDELERVSQETVSIPGAVSDEAAVREIVCSVVESFGRVDVLVNDAGVRAIVLAEETTLADGNKHFLEKLATQNSGRAPACSDPHVGAAPRMSECGSKPEASHYFTDTSSIRRRYLPFHLPQRPLPT